MLSIWSCSKFCQELRINVSLCFLDQGTNDVSVLFHDMNQQFTKEVEDEANSFFQKIYNQPPHPTMTIDEVLEMLKRFKDSINRKEKVR